AAYVDWDVPWNFSINYVMSYAKRGLAKSTYTNNLSFNGDISLTKKWKASFTSAYDFDQKGFSDVTTFSIIRDLHCWELNVNWSPFGPRAYYNIELHVKSAILKDLKLTRKRNMIY
ncbi:MAG TPA: LPS-assembly protein LptD, partial [Cytophagales bacterium]|nr:LPS-assembly protein LptD [Cytophagales bacterium]